MSTDVVIALCLGVGLSMLLQQKHVFISVAIICMIALAYIMIQTKEVTNKPQMEYTAYINTPFEMDVVEQDQKEDKPKDTWHEWNTKLSESTHVQRWLKMFGTKNDFDGFHII